MTVINGRGRLLQIDLEEATSEGLVRRVLLLVTLASSTVLSL